MFRINFKILTFIFIYMGLFSQLHASIFTEQKLKTHLRWNIDLAKEQVLIKKDGLKITIQTLHIDLFNKIVEDISKYELNTEYFKSVTYSVKDYPNKPAVINITLKDQSIELFSFYKSEDRRYVLDYWINKDYITKQAAALKKLNESRKTLPKPIIKTKQDTVVKKKKIFSKKQPVLRVLDPSEKRRRLVNKKYRDFRYGGSFVWDYKALIPPIEKDIELSSKTPDFLFPILDRDYKKDEKEAHMQLTIGLYKKKKWGLMTKSIKLYNKKYGKDSNLVANEYIKANALLKKNISEKNKGVQAAAMNILGDLIERTDDYELKRAVYRYLIQYSMNQDDKIKALHYAKLLYIGSTEKFDNEMTILSSKVILNNLAKLRQIKKIEEFLKDTAVMRTLPVQVGHAYMSFVELSVNHSEKVLKHFEMYKNKYQKPIHPAILFNAAEAYFREAKFKKAIKLFDEFASEYSHIRIKAPQARLRIALSYEMTNRNLDETLQLYKNAIDRTADAAVRYEAKIRYVSLLLNRKINPSEEDIEAIVFLEKSKSEKRNLTADHRKLLWLVRMRYFINSGKYQEALAYLSSIPVESIKPLERKVFIGDGAEIILGIIQKAYEKGDYSEAVKIWEVYKEKYEKKVAGNAYLNFLVCHSYLKLGLMKSYKRSLDSFKKLTINKKRTFPLWIQTNKNIDIKFLISELDLIDSITRKEWKEAEKKLASMPKSIRAKVNYEYYVGIVSYHSEKYVRAIDSFENILVNQNGDNVLNLNEMKELITLYSESLHKINDVTKFQKSIGALIKDINSSGSKLLISTLERIEYLYIESELSKIAPDYERILKHLADYNRKFDKSFYRNRLDYIQGLSLVKSNQFEEGRKVLTEILNNKKAPAYLRKLAKSELAAMELLRRSNI